ncbi:hypothetical protein [Thermophagus xiamenensis]|uniref:Uncharacterized protein n=1 Tax=Thermophagus xiamenensis TaxID=385682 RepID=A0A1I2G1G5_9BACT|nr:hypothetical protein [Thermophagus xiamenensis]SFF10810.1 hypothetical protein SAMN05444380_1436 [Thermophagus xiamenensis]
MENCYVNLDKNQGVPAWYGFSGHNYPAMSISLHNFGYNAIRIEPLNPDYVIGINNCVESINFKGDI